MSEIERAIESINFFKNTDFGGLLKARELLEELQEREKGCEYCNDEKAFEIYRDGEKVGKAWLHKCSDGYSLFLEIDGNGIVYINTDSCPMCGRKLGENDG